MEVFAKPKILIKIIECEVENMPVASVTIAKLKPDADTDEARKVFDDNVIPAI